MLYRNDNIQNNLLFNPIVLLLIFGLCIDDEAANASVAGGDPRPAYV
jgi:hypothetical protein